MKLPVALQLWSVKDAMMTLGVEETLKKVSELGFDGVEFAGFFDVPAEEMKAMLDRCHLKVAGSHTQFDDLVNHIDDVIAYNRTIGNSRIVCPWYDLKDEESLNALAAGLKAAEPKLKAAGMTLYYHNHNHEFFKIGGEFALDRLFASFGKDLLKPEIDTYWVFNAGVNPVDYCRKYQGRCDLIHLKDGTKSASTPVGEGEVDIQAVLDVSCEIGAAWVIMEDETWDPDGMTCVTTGMNNLKTKYNF